MPNVHTPGRQPDETREAYAHRRKASRRAVSLIEQRGLGSQHKAPNTREQLRDSQRKNGNGPSGIFGRSLMAHFAKKAKAAKAAKLANKVPT